MSPISRFVALAATAAVLTATGCSPSDSPTGGDASAGRDGSPPFDGGADAGTGKDGGGSADASPDAGDSAATSLDGAADGPVCAATDKSCGGVCVAKSDPYYGCGAASCTPCILAYATPTCTNQACAVAACAAGYADCDQRPADGCETSLSTAAHCGSCGNACPLPDQCHMLGACDPAAGTCPVLDKPDGTACVAGNTCTIDDVCTSGVCGGTNPCPGGLCGASLSAFTGSSSPGWTLNGTATYDATANTVVLVPEGQHFSAGSVFYDDPIATDAFTVSFDFRMTTSGGSNGRGDGIAFVLQTRGPTALGGSGGGLGFVGLPGYGVELDIYDNVECGDADDNHAGIDETVSCGQGEPVPIATSPNLIDTSPTHGVGDLGDGQWRTATMSLANGQMSVSITDPVDSSVIAVPNLKNVALPGFLLGTAYYFGLSAGGGSLAGRQEIRNVQVSFPSARCL
jgi:hypothetical protein